jgi:hypothetical protein
VAGGVAVAEASTKALAGVAGGLWEVDGVPGHNGAVRSCVADPLQLIYSEHPNADCTPTILGDNPPLLRVSFQCRSGSFGQASVKTITPRSLRIEVQGISDGAPYNHVMQARRIGDCARPGGGGRPERGGH